MENSKIKTFYFDNWKHQFYGWRRIIDFLNNNIKSYEKQPVYLDVAYEKHWIFKDQKNMSIIDHCKSNPWIAFAHAPHDKSPQEWTMEYNIKNNEDLKICLKNLKGIFTVCEAQTIEYKKIPELQNIPISTILHPVPPNMSQFDIDGFDNTIVTMGWHMRNNQILKDIDTGNTKKKFVDGELSKKQYGEIFTKSVVFQNFINFTASNVVCECIASNTPIIANKLPAIVEYLGEDYPLYYNNIQEAEDKIKNLNVLIAQANKYLINLNKTRPLTLNKFVDDIFQSEVYKSL